MAFNGNVSNLKYHKPQNKNDYGRKGHVEIVRLNTKESRALFVIRTWLSLSGDIFQKYIVNHIISSLAT